MHTTDEYDFTQASPDASPGFHLFHSEAHQAWFFHCNDPQGVPILFSQAYQQESSAENGLQAVLKNAEKRSKKLQTDDGQWQFIVKAGNHKEIARSRYFAQEEDCNKGMQYVKKVAKSSEPLAHAPKVIATPPPAVQVEVPPTVAEQPPAERKPKMRHTFRLYFYEGKQGELFGRIEVADSREQTSFTGVDLKAIGNFLRTHLPQHMTLATGPTEATQPTPKLQHRLSATAQSDFRILGRDQVLALQLDNFTLTPDDTLLSVELRAEHTQSTNTYPLTIQQLARTQEQESVIHFMADPAGLSENGMYILAAEATLRTAAGELQRIRASTLFQLV
ncbi:MAG: DUF1508 domain-containing protein [Bacteroidetes bacterium]|nr:MAG: DUF1508 domain-containing protein [Bacteroidota bacterium]